jgi:glycosyltransferase involved in cell wall biosynthesis
VVFLWSQLRLTVAPARAIESSGVPFLYTFNDLHPTGYRPARPGMDPRSIARFIVDRVFYPDVTSRDLALTPSTAISETLREGLARGGMPVDECRVIYQGIPLESFRLKEKPGSLHDPVRILYAGQLHPYKGPDTVIRAVQQISREGRRVELTIVGSGPPSYLNQLRHLASSGPAQVSFTGQLPHASLPLYYRSHDLFVFPSVWEEPFGLTHLEAMASGTPVLSTPHGGPGEFLRDGETALFFPPGDEDALSSRIAQLIDDAALRNSMARAARTDVERRFSLAGYVDQLDALLHQVTHRRSKVA